MLTNRQLFLRHISQTSLSPLMLEIVSAEGLFMVDSYGRQYLDLISGVSVSNTGHRHPKVVDAIKKQADEYLHLMVYGEIIQSPQVRLAHKLSSLLPDSLSVTYFVNSGSEAVEGALKLAKRFTGRSRILFFRNAYHGSTHGALSVQGSEFYKNSFRPLLPDVIQSDFNDPGVTDLIDANTACVIIEPVQAEAGVIYPVNDFLQEIRRKCSKTGTLLIFDEVQTAFGRLGKMFGLEKFGVIPDILVLAKALGGGMPLGAFISSPEIMSTLSHNPNLGHITTFGGHPVCCAAGLASLEVLQDEDLISKVTRKSKLFRKYLNHPAVLSVRGDGLLMGIKTPGKEITEFMISNAPEYGLILDYFLFCKDSFRIAPPLTIDDKNISFACAQINLMLEEAVKKTDRK